MNTLKTFLSTESGAVTVDWVVLTAALVGLGLAVMGVVSTGVQNASNSIAEQLNTTVIDSRFENTNAGTADDPDWQADGFGNGAENN
ncbi:hypothetical protein JQC91_15950 [Jannaschia sp. Os4]|uniref:hypothetical protein n=1 Tax=Jannaschia sp. Os4 TaxID=2807617 RepID=UPI00193A6885|nr:hypothetical protein [Jannaschia sp. Os4]MBM2577800.1 hypothetical protein [Jannaschia sp. Os4]